MTIRLVSARLAASLAASPSPVPAQGPGGLARVAPPAGPLVPGAATTVAARLALPEGPASDAKGDLFFGEVYASRVYRMTPGGAVSVFHADGGRADGDTFAKGRLISCEGAEQPRLLRGLGPVNGVGPGFARDPFG